MSILSILHKGQHTEAVVQSGLRLHLMLTVAIDNVYESPSRYWFEDMKRSWREAEVWHYEKPEEATGEGTAAVQVAARGLKGSWG